VSLKREDLAALRTKYEEMLRLRLESAGTALDPRRAMAALASRFPGALREIDDLPLDTIRARVRDLADAERNDAPEPWMEATHLFHALTRGALCAKRWLAGRKPGAVDDEAREAFGRAAPSFCWAEDALAWKADLKRLASPPHGRLTELVYERIAETMRITEREARLLVFGTNRRERRAGVS
jgi:hypothetical protein